jgi:hypothetical protein
MPRHRPNGFGLAHAGIGRGAIDNEADALLVMPPVHPYLCDEGIRDYLTTLAKELPLPMLAYKKVRHRVTDYSGALQIRQTGRCEVWENNLDAAAKLIKAVGDSAVVSCGIAGGTRPIFIGRCHRLHLRSGNLCRD